MSREGVLSGRFRTNPHPCCVLFTTFTSKRVTTFSAPARCVLQNKPRSTVSVPSSDCHEPGSVVRTLEVLNSMTPPGLSCVAHFFPAQEQSLLPVDDGKLAVGMWTENVDAAMFLTWWSRPLNKLHHVAMQRKPHGSQLDIKSCWFQLHRLQCNSPGFDRLL